MFMSYRLLTVNHRSMTQKNRRLLSLDEFYLMKSTQVHEDEVNKGYSISDYMNIFFRDARNRSPAVDGSAYVMLSV